MGREGEGGWWWWEEVLLWQGQLLCRLDREGIQNCRSMDCMCLLHREGMPLKMCLLWMDRRCLLHRQGMLLKMCLLWMDCRCLLHTECSRELAGRRGCMTLRCTRCIEMRLYWDCACLRGRERSRRSLQDKSSQGHRE